MTAKKIGEAKAFVETGMWGVEKKPERFLMNERLVNLRPDVKAMKNAYSKHIHTKPPSQTRRTERAEYDQESRNLKAEQNKLLACVYAEILTQSFSYPIPLRKDRDADHRSDWRYCLYQGVIYQFDRPGYSDDEMIQQ
ncbi:MAG: hypothetical protein HYZ85_05895, partial [Candidatus Omnitrophica bacterium]|nr:hypothetical protein [Candidatus Omnitrophota bacterium]